MSKHFCIFLVIEQGGVEVHEDSVQVQRAVDVFLLVHYLSGILLGLETISVELIHVIHVQVTLLSES